jgi:hypothetical protein
MSLVRTCGARWARQILLLRRRVLLLAWWLAICLHMIRLRQWLTICSIHGWRLAHTTPDSVRWHERLRLRRYGSEDTILIEPHAV